MAMIINMFVAATAGTLIPLALRAMKVDPALASSVFITTLTDMFGFFSFLGLATLFIKYLHHPGYGIDEIAESCRTADSCPCTPPRR